MSDGSSAVRARLTAGLLEMSALALRTAEQIGPDLERAAEMVRDTVKRGGTLFFCGNGGSAADAQHLATEYVVRYMRNRRAYPAIALTTDTSLITAAGNDIGFDLVFARQVEALARTGALLSIHSTRPVVPRSSRPMIDVRIVSADPSVTSPSRFDRPYRSSASAMSLRAPDRYRRSSNCSARASTGRAASLSPSAVSAARSSVATTSSKAHEL